MKIEDRKVVAVIYDLEVDGNIVDRATEETPLDYIHGTNMLIPRFEAEIEGLEEGDSFAFTVTPEEGYGPYEESRKMDLPVTAFTVGGELREDLIVPGKTVPMMNSQGEVLNAVIVERNGDKVTMDFNHPMAGKTLNFSGKVLSVRDATEKELTEGLHGEFLPPEDDCCCGHHHHHNGDGECCHGHHHEDGECCHGHHHGDGECCHGHHHHEDQ